MVADKIRIKKHQKPKVDQWCEALEITESRFVEDAIAFYLRYLEGKHPIVPINSVVNPVIPSSKSLSVESPTISMPDDPEEFDGGLEL